MVLAIMINSLNHIIKLKQLEILLEQRQANKERTKKVLNLERLILMPSITIFSQLQKTILIIFPHELLIITETINIIWI